MLSSMQKMWEGAMYLEVQDDRSISLPSKLKDWAQGFSEKAIATPTEKYLYPVGNS